MCRHVAYLGPSRPLSRLLFDPPHALAHQAWAPRRMRGSATMNVDGFGVGWFPTPAGPPITYRRDRPVWLDGELPALAAAVTAPAALAAVRSATAGMPAGASACAPFPGDGWLFSLNGLITGWPDAVTDLAAGLPVTDLLTMPAPVDSALVWALLRAELRAGRPPSAAVAATVVEVLRAAPGSRLNLLLLGPDQIVATAAGHSLVTRYTAGAVTVASEPLDDDPHWLPVPDGRLVTASAAGIEVAELPVKGAWT